LFEDDHPNDEQGVLKYTDSVFTGNFIYGVIHGKGRKVWADGDWYEGDFEHDVMQGRGVL
jgi:hypothetical protein